LHLDLLGGFSLVQHAWRTVFGAIHFTWLDVLVWIVAAVAAATSFTKLSSQVR